MFSGVLQCFPNSTLFISFHALTDGFEVIKGRSRVVVVPLS
jgi:hypothetical protein